MHEMAVAESLLRIVLQAAAANGGGPVRVARLAVGALTCVNVECLRFGFEALARGTAAAECSLDVRRVPLRVRCAACGEAELALGADGFEGLVIACPACAGPADVVAGRELCVETITID